MKREVLFSKTTFPSIKEGGRPHRPLNSLLVQRAHSPALFTYHLINTLLILIIKCFGFFSQNRDLSPSKQAACNDVKTNDVKVLIV